MKQPQTYINLLGETVSVADQKKKANPLLKFYGKGPEGQKCKTCSHLYEKQYAGKYFKCDLRPNTNGPGTDHRINWPACGKYQEATK